MNRLAFACVLVVVATSAGAQPRAGDFVVSDGVHIGIVDHRTSATTVLLTGISLVHTFHAVTIAEDNWTLRAVESVLISSRQPAVLSISPITGQATTFAKLSLPPTPLNFHGMPQEQYGSFVLGHNHELFRVASRSFSTLTTLGTVGLVSGVAIDSDTGDYIVSMHDNLRQITFLRRVDGQSLVVSTLAALATGGSAVHEFDPETGFFWFTVTPVQGPASVVLLDLKTLTPARTFPVSSANDIVLDPSTGNVYVTRADTVSLYSRAGIALATWGPFPGISTLASLCIIGSRKLSGSGVTRPGSMHVVNLSFPESPGAFYGAACSLGGMRPGIRVGPVTVPINQDALFNLTVCRDVAGLTSGFTGRLSATGRSTAHFMIPQAVPRGTHITFAAVALNPWKPAGLDAGGALAIVVR